MNERLDRFTQLMRQIFELDKSDLDFGIYRIMNIRRKEINEFLTERLPKQVQEILAPFAQGDKDAIRSEIAKIEQQATSFGLDIASLPADNPMKQKYQEYQQQLASGNDLAALEADVYSALYSFFNRYYDEGDFVSKRRYKEGVYAIPYEGEEVKLYWANQDQYYIKTSENFKDYTFVAEGITVHFMLVDATTEQNNNKESDDNKRQFMLFVENEEQPEIKTFEYRQDTNEFIIRFVFDVPEDKKAKYLELNSTAIRTKIATDYPSLIMPLLRNVSNDPKKEKTLIDRHLEAYVAKNTFDYFIHKDLKGFLNRELDFYIKNEVMHLDDLDTTNEQRVETWLAKVKAIKRVGHIIIDFLAQIEDFQKKLWLKKKFIVETNWCITLDRIDEEFWPEIIANAAQMQEWIDMYAIDDVEPVIGVEGWTNPPTMEFLRQNQNLVVDTKHFSSDFKDRLIASLDDLDEQTDGLMIHSDNYQAMSVLMRKYKNRIPLIYIDPPYNTDASKILYKNNYQHSSWISLMHSRLQRAHELLNNRGIIEVAIDDFEFRYLNLCLDQIFGIDNAISNVAIFTNPKGRDQGFIAQAHDYTLLYAKNKQYAETNKFILSDEEMKKKFSKSDGDVSLRELPLKRTGTGKRREERPYMYFPFMYDIENQQLHVVDEETYKRIYNPTTQTFDDNLIENLKREYEAKGWAFMLPLSSTGECLRWRWGYASCVKGIESNTIFAKQMRDGSYAMYQYDLADAEATPKSMWVGERYDASSKGTNLLENILPGNPFKYPKSLYTVEDNIIMGSNDKDTVLDFFAGSATTGHAVIDLNRSGEDKRKYILVDMGEHFDTVMRPRIKKVAYSASWKNGKPLNRNTGISHIMKYFSLESYEDALSNIQLEDEHNMLSLFGDDYLIHYMLDVESKGSILDLEQFKAPFSYKLKINERNETKTRVVDLVETFNYLIGLTVVRQSKIDYFRSEEEKNGEYDGAVHLISDVSGDYGFKQVEGTLPDGRRALIIWRTITEDLIASNAALDAYFRKHRINPQDHEFDVIYVNGDNNLENLKTDSESWKVCMTEIEFQEKMFEEV